jgi:hypothetical protein
MTSVNFSVRIDSRGTLDRVQAQLEAMPKGIERARRRALKKIMTWLKRQVLRAVARAAGLTQKAFQAMLRYRATQLPDAGISIWIGTNDIPVHRLGTVTWTPRMKGARVSKRSFPGTWSWGEGSRTGTAVMQRIDTQRLPIERVEQDVDTPVRDAVAALEPEINARFEREMLAALKYELYRETMLAA